MHRIGIPVVVAMMMASGCGTPARPTDGPAADGQARHAPADRAQQAPRPDPDRGTPVAIIRGTYIYDSDLEDRDIHEYIGRPLIEEFISEHQLEPAEEQLAFFDRWMATLRGQEHMPEEAQEDLTAAQREIAHAMVQQWLLNKALYERYGGTVIFQQANPMEPVGAYRQFFEEHEARGTFRILDPEQREEFWSYYKRDHGPFEVPEERIDFSRPWWEQTGR